MDSPHSVTRPTAISDTVRRNLFAARTEGAVAQRWSEALAASGSPDELLATRLLQVHYKPLDRARLVLQGRTRRPGQKSRRRRYLYVQIYRDAERARERLARASRGKRVLSSLGPPHFGIDDWHAVAWSLPNGPRLRGLRSFLQRKALCRFLRRHGLEELEAHARAGRRPRLVRYVPRRRALLHWRPGGEVPTLYVKLYGPGLDTTAAANLRWVAAAGLPVPALFLHAAERRAVLATELRGTTLTARLLKDRGVPFGELGDVLARLQSQDPAGLDAWGEGRHLRALALATRDVATALPALARPLGALVERITAATPALDPTVPVHGNLFGDQILVRKKGVGIVDWDDLSVADPAFDLGRLIAHLRFLALGEQVSWKRAEEGAAELLAGYGRDLDPALLGWHVARELLMRAKISCLRVLPGDWEEWTALTVEEAGRCLDGRALG